MAENPYEALLFRAKAALAIDASPAALALLNERLQQLSSELLLEWLLGDKRFESQSQQTEYWLGRFYDEIFTDEQPSASLLYQRFNLSLPRANYIERLLRARGVARWRNTLRAELKTQLQRNEKKALKAKADGNAHILDIELSLSRGATEELRTIYDRLASFSPEHERPKQPKTKSRFGDSLWLLVPAETLLLVLDYLKGDKSK